MSASITRGCLEDTTEGVMGYKANNNPPTIAPLLIIAPVQPLLLSISCFCNDYV